MGIENKITYREYLLSKNSVQKPNNHNFIYGTLIKHID